VWEVLSGGESISVGPHPEKEKREKAMSRESAYFFIGKRKMK
jgi:hypothetical protein